MTEPPSSSATSPESLPSLLPSGRPPESRITSAAATRDLVLSWQRNDREGRDPQRALVTGLIQGNPPYTRARLVKLGRRDAHNINMRNAEAYEEAAKGALYDLFSEAPTLATVTLRKDAGDGTKAVDRYSPGYSGDSGGYSTDGASRAPAVDAGTIADWSAAITEAFDRLIKSDPSWDSVVQNSIRNTVRFGAGPMIFADDVDWRNLHVEFECLLVPDDASSDINRWECAALLMDYLPHQLYELIVDESAARDAGCNVEQIRRAIVNAVPENQAGGGNGLSWEAVQQQLKQNSYSYSARSKIISVVHFFAREFPDRGRKGKISHVMFLLNPVTSVAGEQVDADTFLFRRDRLYERWQQCIHPMYYSQGEGGKHYGVTGQGVKMYGMMVAENHLFNNMLDKAVAPKIMFKPTTASAKQKALPVRHGDYMMMPDGYDLQQMSVGSMIEEGLVVSREIRSQVSANLSTYRQNLEAPKSGNPITRGEAEIRAQDQARLGKTQINRFYEQWDWLYEEKYRRACAKGLTESDPGGREALEFQRECERCGVPREALLKYSSVKATRVAGQGSPYLRQQAYDFAVAIAGALPEEGRERAIKGSLSARFGYQLAEQFWPKNTGPQLASDQQAEAIQMVAVMKTGVPAPVTSSQNPMVYATVFLRAAAQALGSMAQGGGGPDALIARGSEVLSFLQLIGPAIAAHLQRMANDPTRKSALPALEAQFKRVAQGADKLKAAVERAVAQRQKAAADQQRRQIEAGRQALAITQGQDPDLVVGLAGVERNARVKEATARANAELKARKLAMDGRLKSAKTAQDLAIADRRAATDIALSAAETAASIELDRQKARAKDSGD